MSNVEAEAGRSLLSGIIGGRHSTPLASARAGLKVEVGELKKVSKEFDVIRKSVSSLRKEMDALRASSDAAMGSVRGVRGGGVGSKAQNGMPLYNNTSPAAPPSASTVGPSSSGAAAGAALGGGGGGGVGGGRAGMFGGPSRGGMFANFGGGGMAALVLAQGVSMAVGAVDSRIDRGMSYASNADRLNLILQQRTGVTQGQALQQRKPLANYRLGTDGISSMIDFQTQYGMQATPQMAQSIAGIRALNGYTKTTQGVLQDQASLMDPRVANRMYNMLGVNAYTSGGGINDPIKMRQDLTQTLGLNNAVVLKGARTPGSAVRAMMTDAGIPLEVQDEVLAQAESNLTFQKKGGKGQYDPSKKSHRDRMGIEKNFATEQEETERLRASREEAFTRRQIDNMADLERSNQMLVKALGSLEDKISGLIGMRTSSRNWQGILGKGLQVAGFATMAAAGWTGVGAVAGGAMMVGGSAMAGDPEEGASSSGGGSGGGHSSDSSRDASISIPVGYNGKRASLNEVKGRSDFKSMNSKMQQRLLAMFRENPNVGIGGGFRSSSEQETLFRSRYRKTSKKTNIFWEGSHWEHVSGAAAAPPGRSMHEIGLAADLVGDLDWMNQNASRFGLKHFAGVNSEPWHVQPAELPNSRREYEKGGSQWGTDGGFEAGSDEDGSTKITTGDDGHGDEHGSGGAKGGGSAGLRSFAGMSISDILAAMQEDGVSRLGGTGTATGGRYRTVSSTKSNSPSTSAVAGPSGAIPGERVAQAAYRAGFRGDNLIKMIAIAKRESGWKPRAYNGNLKTGDQSYGLWQLNTLNKAGSGMMGDLFNEFLGKPKGNKDFDALFDPDTNGRGAKFLSDRSGGTLKPWGGYKGKSDTYNADKYIAEATQIVKSQGMGDPMPSESMMGGGGGGRSSTHVSMAPTYQITVSPQITFVGSPSTPDLKNIAHEVTALIHDGVRKLEMRSA